MEKRLTRERFGSFFWEKKDADKRVIFHNELIALHSMWWGIRLPLYAISLIPARSCEFHPMSWSFLLLLHTGAGELLMLSATLSAQVAQSFLILI